MIGTPAQPRYPRTSDRTRWTSGGRRLWRDRAGTAPGELAFVLAFLGLIAATGFVVVGDELTDHLTEVSDRVETATVAMPNPLGGGAVTVASNVAGGGESNGGGNANGNGGGNSNGNSGKNS